MVRDVVIHEVGHYFGLDDETMEGIEDEPDPPSTGVAHPGRVLRGPALRAPVSQDQIHRLSKFFLTLVSFVPIVSAYAENDGTSETLRKMASTEDIRTIGGAAGCASCSRRATDWQESRDVKVGRQTADLLVKFKHGRTRSTPSCSKPLRLVSPAQIREAITRLADIRRELPDAYPVAVSPVHQPAERRAPQAQRARLPRSLRQLLPVLRQRADREGGEAESPALHAAAQVALRAPRDPRGPGAPRRSRRTSGGSRSWPRRPR